MHLHRPRSRTVLGWLAAALAAAAAVWTPLALVAQSWWALGGLAALPYLARADRERLIEYFVGVGLVACALYGAFILLLVAGGCSDDGNVAPVVWAIGATIFLAIATWSLLGRRRAWWGLPLATVVSAVAVVGLATALTGSTGACLS
jgi:hypothetical protein